MSETFIILLPQSVLAVLACAILLGGTFRVPSAFWPWAALVSLALAAAAMFLRPDYVPGPDPLGVVTHDYLATGFQWGCLAIAAIFVLTSWGAQSESGTSPEFHALLLLAVSGTMLVSAANDLVLMMLALELISVPTYVLLYLGRRDYSTQESAVKYFLLSVMSSAVLLYGFALVYGLTGTTNLYFAQTILANVYGTGTTPPSVLGVVAMVLVMAGLGFKIAAVPFHFYAPDVYQGTSAFNAGFLAVVPKAAGFIALIRVANETLTGFEGAGERTALILAIITMTGGNCLALWQTNIRRLLAYSSIAHAGYMLIGIAVAFWDRVNPDLSLEQRAGLPGGAKASLLYLLAYCIASAGMFAVLVYLARRNRQIDHVEELTGLGRTQPLVAIAAALFLFSMTGIPPLAGFWGKLAVFSSALSVRTGSTALHQGFAALAVIGVLNAAVAAVYYVKIVAIMFLNDPIGHPKPEGGRGAFAAVLASALLVLGIGLFPGSVFEYLSRTTPVGVSSRGVDPRPQVTSAPKEAARRVREK